ncbi:site-specific DNA-methyltransferase [Bosea robiniae]|uniref:site-specific DNA-methyltransferase (adenine-specific) n=1 Tax=Bosea robiniae TaxID=1036780 RepID=A0ABY0P405_9HYPH|nr:site-specific DNA-methyltransferase [Bosea robiniae]SDH20065.1 adenine-specific DNA-methyltransferase [Bosea robiniae]
MATGINRQEQLGEDALTAVLPHRDPYPLPEAACEPVLSYPGRLTTDEILQPLASGFATVSADGALTPSPIIPNSVVLTDNLFGLHQMIANGTKATLIYLDPPYNTGLDFQSRQLEHSYKDSQGVAAYVEYMRRRLVLMREVLADDGSIYVHIGHQMVSHLRVVMDEIFGAANFRNLISRRTCSSKNYTRNRYSNMNDYVLFYSKTANFKWNQPGEKPPEEWIAKEYNKIGPKGRYKLVPVHAPGTRNGATGGLWKGMMPPPGKHWQYLPSKLDEMDANGDIHWSKTGNPRRKVHLTDDKLVPYTDSWTNFRDAHHQSIEITGYPTEKNLHMMRMIVGASSDPGDLVLDPFCGSGTTLRAAEDQGRRWIGFDQSFAAIKATLKRLRHGSEKMGDYVDRGRTDDEDDPKVVDLFGAPDGKNKVETKPPSNRAAVNFTFAVDEELIDPFRNEISALAST